MAKNEANSVPQTAIWQPSPIWQRTGLPLYLPIRIMFILWYFLVFSTYKHRLSVEIFVTMKQLNDALNLGILAQTQKLDHLTMLLRTQLPPECDGHYDVAAIHGSTLVIVTDSPVWTTRLRQLGPLILQSLENKTAQYFQHVRIISRHGPVVSNYELPVVKRELSQQSRHQITQAAKYIKDKPLKEALLKIAQHGKKK